MSTSGLTQLPALSDKDISTDPTLLKNQFVKYINEAAHVAKERDAIDKKLEAVTDELASLKNQISTAEQIVGSKLEDMAAPEEPAFDTNTGCAVIHRYDSIKAGNKDCVFIEKVFLNEDSGYGRHLPTRLRETVNRAMSPVRVGDNYEKLPAFKPNLYFEITVALKEGNGENLTAAS